MHIVVPGIVHEALVIDVNNIGTDRVHKVLVAGAEREDITQTSTCGSLAIYCANRNTCE